MAEEKKKEAPIGGGLVFMSQEALRASFANAPYPVLYPEIVRETILIPAHDGEQITLSCFIPKGEPGAAYPAIVRRGNGRSEVEAEELAKRGFIYVWAESPRRPANPALQYEHWREDGIATLEYLNQQPWISRIGYRGGSAGALACWCMADALPEKVESLYLTVYGTDRYASCYQDGIFRPDFCGAPVKPMPKPGAPGGGPGMGAPGLGGTGLQDALMHWPHVEADEALAGKQSPWYRQLVTSPDFDAPLWQEGFWKLLRDMPGKTQPHKLYMMEGWFDHHLHATLVGYPRFPKAVQEQIVFQIGPWNHFDQVAIYGHPEQKNGDFDETVHALQWFEDTLQEGKPVEGCIQYYMIGADEWRTTDTYPFRTSGEKVLYFGEGTLLDAPAQDGSICYQYDPNDPVISNGGEAMLEHAQTQGGSRKQPEPNWRQDVISFVSQPMEEALEILGRIKVQLYVQSDAADTAFGFKIMEVFPNGEAYHIRNGMASLGYRNHALARQSYDGSIVDLEIDAWDIAWRIQAGSRIRVDISSSNCPEYAIHPNTAAVWSEERNPQIANQTLCFGQTHPAKVILPLA